MSKESIIQIKNLFKQYSGASDFSLKNINFDILKAEKIGFLGPNGAGKTTLISIICNIIEASTGTVTYQLNNNTLSPKEIKTHIGFVPQEYAFYPELSPMQNLQFFGAMYSLSKNEVEKRAHNLLELLGLSNVKNQKIETFSGGMKRRVNLAIGLINNPSIIILDEPTVGVDVQSKNAIISFLNELNQNGTSIIYTSHHLQEAESFCDRIVLIDKGEIVVSGIFEQLQKEYAVSDLTELFIQLTGKEYRDNA